MEKMASSSDIYIDEKLGQLKEDIMQKMDEKLDSKFDLGFLAFKVLKTGYSTWCCVCVCVCVCGTVGS